VQARVVKHAPGLNQESPSDKVESKKLIFENRIWSVRDVSEYTGYAVGTLYNLASQDLVPHRKKRGRLFFIPLEIHNWIEEGNLK
jgi:predicted DNA-binding transcriptional regulator AlpA